MPLRVDCPPTNLTHPQWYIWLYHQMCKAYRVLRDEPNALAGRKWGLPVDRAQRQEAIDRLPVQAFQPEIFLYSVVPHEHLPSRERLAELGLIMTADAYNRHAMRLQQGRANARGVDMSLGQQQFVAEVQRLERQQGAGNLDASMVVAAAVSGQDATNVAVPISDAQLTSRVTELVANANATDDQVEVQYRQQRDRMKRHRILKFHGRRMNTHKMLAHFDRAAFEYFRVVRETDVNLKKCLLSSDTMGVGVEMLRFNCGSVNADQADSVYAVFVTHFSTYLINIIK